MVAWAQFSADGEKLLTVRERHFVQLWDWREGIRLAPEIPRRSVLFHASLSPDGSKVLTVAWSGFAHLYDAASSRRINQFEHQGGLLDAAFSPDGRHIAIACHDGNVWLWDLEDDFRHPMMLPEGNQIEEIAFSHDGRLLAVGTRGGHARVWDLFPPQRGVRRLPGSDVAWVEFDRSARRALLLNRGTQSGVSVYDVQTSKLISASRFEGNEFTCARFSPDGRRILVFGNLAIVLVLDADTGRELVPPLMHDGRPRDAVWSPDGKFILTTADATGARAWDSATGKVTVTFPHSNSVSAIAFSPDGARLATGHQNNTVQIWETLTGRPAGPPLTVLQEIRELAFSPDGRRLAISTSRHGTEGIVEVRDVATGELVGRPPVHRDSVVSFEFSRDGRWLATACEDHTARVWDASTGNAVSPWLPQDFEARQAIFSPDGTRLATIARRGAVRLWSARTGEPITAPLLYPRNTGDGRVSYSPDGQRLLLARGGNEAWLRELQPETANLEELRLLAEVLSCTTFDPAAGMVPLDETGLHHAWDQLRALRKLK
jgi:WD40 repeat protein